jgi:site-specific recombinase XerD
MIGVVATAQRRGSEALQAILAGWLENYDSRHTRAAYRSDLEHFSRWSIAERVDPFDLDAADVQRYRAACEASGVRPSTVARRLSAIASFAAFALQHGYSLGAPRVDRPVVPVPSSTGSLSDDDATAILAAADNMNPRSALLVRLLVLDGLKIGEAVAADAADVSGRPPHMTLTLHGAIARDVQLHNETAASLAAYLGKRRRGPLLLSEHRARISERLTRFGVDYVIKQAAEIAGISGPVSGNTLRRRFVAAAYERGEDLDDIRQNAGHADVRTTRRYLPDTQSTDVQHHHRQPLT